MPRYELRRTSDNELYYVEGALPLNLSGLVPVGTYRARAMSTEEPTDIVLELVNPDFTSLSYASPGGGEPNELTLTYTYGGADTLVAYGVTSTEAIPPGADAVARRANIIAGTGTGNIEGFAVDPFSGSTLELIEGQLTAASESATHVHIFISEKNNGGFSEIRTVAVSDLDFTAPTLSTAVATNANTVVLTFSENVFGTVASSQFAFNINGSAATITGAVHSGTTVTLTVSNTMLAGQTLNALAYTPGVLKDAKGTAVAAFSGQSITNSLVAGFTDSFTRSNGALNDSTNWFDASSTAGAELQILNNQVVNSQNVAFKISRSRTGASLGGNIKCGFTYISASGTLNNSLIGPIIQRVSDGANYFLQHRRDGSDVLLRYRATQSGTASTLVTYSTRTLAANDILELRRIELDASTVRVQLFINGTQYGSNYDDTAAGRVTGAAYGGIFTYGDISDLVLTMDDFFLENI